MMLTDTGTKKKPRLLSRKSAFSRMCSTFRTFKNSRSSSNSRLMTLAGKGIGSRASISRLTQYRPNTTPICSRIFTEGPRPFSQNWPHFIVFVSESQTDPHFSAKCSKAPPISDGVLAKFEALKHRRPGPAPPGNPGGQWRSGRGPAPTRSCTAGLLRRTPWPRTGRRCGGW